MSQKKRLTNPKKKPNTDIKIRNADHAARTRFRMVFGFGCMDVVISDSQRGKERYPKEEETYNNISTRHQPH
jgi:hypothetical protein